MSTTPSTTRTHTRRIALLLGIALALAVGAGAVAAAGGITVSDETATAGDRTEVVVSMPEAPDGLQRYNVTVHLENAEIAMPASAAAGDVEGFQVRSTTEDSITFRAADLSESVQPGATDVTLGTITLEASNPGSADLTATVHDFQNDDGEQSEPAVSGGTVTVQGGGASGDGSLQQVASNLPGPTLAWAAGAVALALVLVVAFARRL